MIKEEEEKDKKKISIKLNEILIERIKKYKIQDTSQLINCPNDGDTNIFFLGGLINFDMEKIKNWEYEINNDLDKISVKDIYIRPFRFNNYENDEEEEEEENEGISNNNKNNNIKNTIIDFNNEQNSQNISVLLNEDFNQYLDLIQKNYKRFENNHFPKLKDNYVNKNKNQILNNVKDKIYETKKGEKIILNNELYQTSLAFLKTKDLFYDMPGRYKKDNSEFTVDYNLLEENINNILIKSQEFINMNSKISTSMSKVLFYSNYLDKYIEGKLEPFNDSINISYEKIQKDKIYIAEIKTKTMQNSGNIILKRLKMDNTKKLISKLKMYKNLKNIIDSLELLFSNDKNKEDKNDLINKCKEEIENIKAINNKENNNESTIELFEKKLNQLKNRNDAQISGEFSQILNNYFNNFLTIDNEKNKDKNEIFEECEKYGISKFVSEKICSLSEIYEKILINLDFPSPKKELGIIEKIYDYYIESHLINNFYIQLRGIFVALSEQAMDYILSVFEEKLNNEYNNSKKESNNEDKEMKEINNEIKNEDNLIKNEDENTENENIDNKKDKEELKEQKNDKMGDKKKEQKEKNDNDKIFILLCILLSKNKLNETTLSFINLLLKKIEISDNIDKELKEKIIKECNEIKIIIQDNIKNIIKEQIQKCLEEISKNDNLDIYINNYYLVLEMIKKEISNYDSINSENKNINKLIKIIIKEQKNFIAHWAKLNASKFDTDIFKSWEIVKKIPPKYQNILNLFFSYDIESNCMKDEDIITKFPSEKLNSIKEALEEEENNEENEIDNGIIIIKDGEKPELKLKINETGLEIINFCFEILKMFTLFHKECYGNIFGNVAVIMNAHLNYQNDMIYGGEYDFEVTQSETCMSYNIFQLIKSIYEHIKENDFFYEIAKYSKQKVIDNYIEITTNINNCLDKSKKKIEEILDKKCLEESFKKLEEIELPNYNAVIGDIPIKEYALVFVSQLKDIYENMLNCYEESFIIEIVNKALEEFFDKFEDFIFHGQKIENENCLKQFKRDTIFLKKNLVFIDIIDLTEIKNRIDNINKSVLPESMLKTKKK